MMTRTPPNNPGRMRHGESGNVFAFVLMGVVLFGALMFTVSRSGQQGSTNLTRKQVEIAASDILSYAQRLERGVQRVMTHECSELFINFAHDTYPEYPDNSTAPADNRCDVFHPAGGAITPIGEENFNIAGLDIRPSGGSALLGIGTDGGTADPHQDLVVWFSGLPLELCNELNDRVDYDGAIPTIGSTQAWEYGQQVSSARWGSTMTDLGALAGRPAGCVNQPSTPVNDAHLAQGYSFYYVLYPR